MDELRTSFATLPSVGREFLHDLSSLSQRVMKVLFRIHPHLHLVKELHMPHSDIPGVHMSDEKISVLVVEDEKLLSWSLARCLCKWGFHVQPVSTGRGAVEAIRESPFDIILLDYQLPDLDGLEVAKRIRRTQPNAIIFLVTAFQLNELNVAGGLIDAYFNKPLDLQQLRLALNKIWKENGHVES